jgi:hypothetical protein
MFSRETSSLAFCFKSLILSPCPFKLAAWPKRISHSLCSPLQLLSLILYARHCQAAYFAPRQLAKGMPSTAAMPMKPLSPSVPPQCQAPSFGRTSYAATPLPARRVPALSRPTPCGLRITVLMLSGRLHAMCHPDDLLR